MLNHRRVRTEEIPSLYRTLTEPVRMLALLRIRRRRDLAALFRRIAEGVETGQTIPSDQFSETLREQLELLQPLHLIRDAEAMVEENRRIAADRTQAALVRRRIEVCAAHAERGPVNAMEHALVAAVHASGNGHRATAVA